MVKVSNLTKYYDELCAVNDLSFEVQAGEILGFLGPNGAGKSTTMKIITGFIAPSSGEASVDGHSILTDTVRAQKKIGYVPENAPLYEELTVYDFLKFISRMREIAKDDIPNAIEDVIEKCSLQNVKHQYVGTLSKGFKRRVCLAQALIHNPDVLILDEPTDGLDPNQKHDVRNLIQSISKDKCIILSTHILEEVEAVCTRAIILSEGEKKFDGTPQELKSKSTDGKLDDVFRAITLNQNVKGVQL